MTILVYGANGYVGSLLLRVATERDIEVIAAGRSNAVADVGARYGVDFRVGPIEAIGLDGVDVVVNVAGPFSSTSAALVDRCIDARTHYLDIAGEVADYDVVRARSQSAITRGVMLLPGVGFGVVPTDCAAALAAAAVDDPTRLDIAFATHGGVSGGTLRTMTGGFGDRGVIPEAELATRTVSFPSGEVTCVQNPWRGDLITAPITTGVDDVRTWISVPGVVRSAMRSAHRRGNQANPPTLTKLLRRYAGRAGAGPSEKKLRAGSAEVWAQASNAAGGTATVVVTTPDAYLHTVDAALAAAQRVADGEAEPGFRTPAGHFGADFVAGLPGVEVTTAP